MSPTAFRYGNKRFFFFSREETRIHIHVVSPDGEAKIWLEPKIEIAKSIGYSQKAINEVLTIVKENKYDIIEKWNQHFSK